MKMYLDISEVDGAEIEIKADWPCKIPIKPGEHELDYDLIMEELPEEVVKQVERYYTDNAYRFTEIAKIRPIGFNLSQLPEGAKIINPKRTGQTKKPEAARPRAGNNNN